MPERVELTVDGRRVLVAAGATVAAALWNAGVHALRTAVRPAVTASTFGLGNAAVSVVEDIVSTGLVVVAVLTPLLIPAALVALSLAVVLLVHQFGRRVLGRGHRLGVTR